MELEKLYTSKFDYNVTVDSDTRRSFIVPLLLFPFVQWATSSFHTTIVGKGEINIHIIVDNEIIIFTIRITGEDIISTYNKELQKARERLDILYKDKYTFEIRSDHKESDLILELNNG